MKTSQFQMHSSIIAVAASLMSATGVRSQTVPSPAQAGTPPAPSSRGQPGTQSPAPSAQSKRDEIVVTGARSDVNARPDRVSFNVSNDLQAQTGSVADALRNVPGVEVDIEGRVSLRGDPGVEILIDGRPSATLRGGSRGDVLLSMPAGQIERVEVITNPSAAFSPEGSGGVLNLITKKARRDTSTATVRAALGGEGRGSANLNGTHSSSGLTLTGDLAYRRFAGEANNVQLRSRLDPASGTFLPSRLDTVLDNANSFRSARVGAEYDINAANRLSSEVSYRQSRGTVDRTDTFVSHDAASSFDRVADNGFSSGGFGAQASWRRTLPGKEHEFVADLQFERSWQDQDVEAVTTFTSAQPAFESIRNSQDGDNYTAKLDYRRPLGEDSSLNLGYQGTARQNAFDASGERGGSLDAFLPIPGLANRFGYEETIHAFYGTYRFSLGKLNTQVGLRLEQADIAIDQITDDVRVENGYFRIYPTLHLGYELSADDQLRGSYSRRIQRPSPQDLNPHISYVDPLNLRQGNPFLRPEVTDSFELAWQHRAGDAFYSVTGFHRRSSGGVTEILSDIGNGVFLTSRANLATAERTGAEFVANGKLSKKLSYNASATLIWTKIDPRLGSLFMPRSGASGTARATLSWQPTPKDFVQISGFYSGKQLLPQGYRLGSSVLNLGYRRKINDRLSLLLTANNVLNSAGQTIVFDTPTIRDRFVHRGVGRNVQFGFSYNLGEQGARKRPEPAFDFGGATSN
jgi:outer membrane receptor protein involved in Fe transport